MKDRIRQLMESQHLTQQSFADMLQISAASLSSIFNDRTKPTLNHVDAIKRCFPDVSLDWLLYGNGDMYGSSSPAPAVEKNLAAQGQSDLFLDFGNDSPTLPSGSGRNPVNFSNIRRDTTAIKNIDKPTRQITEIRIFYDDQTWETFIPKK